MFWEWIEVLCDITFGGIARAESRANRDTKRLYHRAILVLAEKWGGM